MAKNSAEKNMTGFALQFLGGLVFLAVAWQLWGVASPASGWNGGVFGGAFIATLLYAGAVLGAVSLLFTSFTQLGSMAGMASWKAMKTTSMVGFALVVLTITNPTWFVVTLIGFLVGSAGAVSGMMNVNWKDMKK